MVMPCAARVQTRYDRVKREAPLAICEHVTAQAKPRVVIISSGIGVPKVDKDASDRPTRARQYIARKLPRSAGDARLSEIATLRRARLEEWPPLFREASTHRHHDRRASLVRHVARSSHSRRA
jgi:hypothetical protein